LYSQPISGVPNNLLCDPIAALGGTRNPHVQSVRSGFCVPSALHSNRTRRLFGTPASDNLLCVSIAALDGVRNPVESVGGLQLAVGNSLESHLCRLDFVS